jgi:hypothetical protein
MTRQKTILLLALLLAALSATSQEYQGLIINELMQSNVDCIMDDRNDFPDSWVELYNGTPVGERLNKYMLGTTPDPRQAKRLNSQVVIPEEHVLIFCDKVDKGIHTDFRLESGKGCSLYLFRDSILVDSVVGLPKQPAPNISYGRKTDGSPEWGYQLTPTPEDPNEGGICDHDHILGDPIFSETGRVLTDSRTITVALSMPEGSPEGTVIRYTTDGTEPHSNSPRYIRPFKFTDTRIVRAKLFCEGWLSPRSVTQSYIFFPRQMTLPVISIATDIKYLNDAYIGIFTNNDGKRSFNWRRPVNVEFFFGEDSVSAINQLCETRVTGAASRGAQKKSMALYAHKRFGTKRFNYEFFPDQCPGLTDFKSIVLRNAGNDFDYLYMRDALVQRTMATHADLDWQAWRPAIVYINGQYYGMLNIRERANENNVYTHYDGLEDIDLFENWNSLKEGDDVALKQFKAFYAEHGHTMAEYEQWMDCYEFINLMIMNLYFNNYDFPGNNIIMWRPRTEGGRWRWIAKDCDYTIGLYDDPVTYNIIEWLHNPSYDSNKNWGANGSEYTRLFRRLMEDEDFNREFIDRCAIYMGDFLNEQGITKIWDPMYQLISYEYPNHRKLINQWWPKYSEELSKAHQWLNLRTDIFYQQLADYYNLGTPVPMTINKSADVTVNGVRLSEGLFNGKFYAGRQLTVESSPIQSEGDGGRPVIRWRVLEINNGKTKTTETEGPLLSMVMPQCSRLVINPIVSSADGIDMLADDSWNRLRDDHHLYLTGIPTGTRVALYDLRGLLLYQATATGADITLPATKNQPYILRVGSKTLKIK